MYTVYLFIVTFAVLVSNATSEDSISTKLDGESVSISTDDLCTKSGFVKKDAASLPRTKRNKNSIYDASTVPKMSAVDIVLTVLGVTVGVIVVAYLGNYFYNKHKVN